MLSAPQIAPAAGPYPPGPPFLPRILSGEAFRQNAAEFMVQCAGRYGDLVHYRALGRHVYQFNHPALLEEFFLRNEARHDRNIVMQRARAVLGNGLLTSEEPLHMRQRRLAQPAFHRARIAGYGEVIGRQAVAMAAGWQPGVRDLRHEMLSVALRIVAECLFSLSVESEAEIRSISRAVDAFMGFLPLAFLPLPELLMRAPVPSMRRIRKGIAQIDELIYGMIRKRRALSGGAGLVDRGDLLAMLMGAVDAEAAGSAEAAMSDTQLRDECVTILLAGHETTANALSFALWLLAWWPEVQEALREEAQAVLGERAPVAEDYRRLRYATQVFSEAMRLYPPVWVTSRTCAEPYEVAGYRIPRGALLLAPQFVVQRDARWFRDPLEFDPARFAGEKPPRYAYFPFGAGSRQCIGEGLAWMEGVFVLAVIARSWRLSPPEGASTEIALNPAISLRPRDALMIRLERAE